MSGAQLYLCVPFPSTNYETARIGSAPAGVIQDTGTLESEDKEGLMQITAEVLGDMAEGKYKRMVDNLQTLDKSVIDSLISFDRSEYHGANSRQRPWIHVEAQATSILAQEGDLCLVSFTPFVADKSIVEKINCCKRVVFVTQVFGKKHG